MTAGETKKKKKKKRRVKMVTDCSEFFFIIFVLFETFGAVVWAMPHVTCYTIATLAIDCCYQIY